MRGRILFQFTENRRALQIFAGSGVRWINRFPPGRAILFVNELRHRNLRKIRIAQKFRPIEKRPPERLDRQMNRLRRPVSQLGQIVAFQNIQDSIRSTIPPDDGGGALMISYPR